MKQLLKLCIIVIGIAFLVILSKNENDKWDDLAYSNIEALASGEEEVNMCAGSGSVDCGVYKVKYKITGYSIGL
jgi:hypothetical protein